MLLRTLILRLSAIILMGLSFAEVVERIDISGLEIIDRQLIQSEIEIEIGQDIGDAEIRSQIKSLYKTGYFEQVRVEIKDGLLIIALKEQPVIRSLEVNAKGVSKEMITQEMTKQGIEPGEIFHESKFSAIISSLRGSLEASGLKNVDVDVSIRPYTSESIDIVVDVMVKSHTKLKAISFTGDPIYSDHRLKSQLRSRTTGALSFLTNDDTASEMAVEQDRRLLTQYYQSHGYLNASITSAINQVVPKQRVWENQYTEVTYDVMPGQRYSIRNIVVEDKYDQVSDRQKSLLDRKLVQKPFNKNDTEKAVQTLTRQIKHPSKRYILASNIQLVSDNQVDLYLQVQEVESRVRFIHFMGNYNTKDHTLRKNIKLRENDLFIEADLVDAVRQLSGKPYIQSVHYSIQPISESSYDVIFEVAEVEKGTFNIGGNGGLANGKLNASVFASDNNFLGTGDSISVNASLSGPTQSAQVSYSQPNYSGSGASRSVSAKINRTSRDDEESTNYSFDEYTVSGNWVVPLSNDFYTSLMASYARMEFFNTDMASSLVKDYFEDRPTEVDLLKVGSSIRYIDLDNHYDPRQGISLSVSANTTLPVGNPAKFYSIDGEAQAYYELAEIFDQYFILRSRAIISYTETYDDDVLPFFARKYAGGMGTVRGYENGLLGPKYQDKKLIKEEDGDLKVLVSKEKAKGGGILLVGNVEVKTPTLLPDLVSSYLFVDIGNVFETPSDIDFSELRGSAGITFSGRLPVVAADVSLSFAVPFNDGGESFETISFGFGKMF
jgi:outer membrane protein insertion porin family